MTLKNYHASENSDSKSLKLEASFDMELNRTEDTLPQFQVCLQNSAPSICLVVG